MDNYAYGEDILKRMPKLHVLEKGGGRRRYYPCFATENTRSLL